MRWIVCFSLILSLPAQGADSTEVQATKQAELEKLRQKISALQQDLEKTNTSKSEAADALRESERAISHSKRTLSELTQQQRIAHTTQKNLQQQARKVTRNVQEQQEMLGQLLYQQYLGGQQGFVKLLLNDPNQTLRDLQYYQYIARSRATWLASLRGNLQQMNEITAHNRQKVIEIASLQTDEQMQKLALEKERQARQQVIKKYAQQLKQQRREINRLQQNESRLAQLLQKLATLLAQNQGEFNSAPSADNNFDGRPFAQLKGQLSLPIKGVVTNQFGDTRPDSTLQWKGLQLRAASGQPVKAIAAGRVVFADWLRGFGNLLILDHGNGYMSLYAHNETLFKRVGDTLRGGDTIATVGNSGGNEDFGLYFELRHEGRPLDPMRWLGANKLTSR